jgi:hypothetical protein
MLHTALFTNQGSLMEKHVQAKLLMLTGTLCLAMTGSAFATSHWAFCITDVKQMEAQLAKYPTGPLIAQNALVDRIHKYPYWVSTKQCGIKCHTDVLGDGTCTWDRGNWGDTLRYKQTP